MDSRLPTLSEYIDMFTARVIVKKYGYLIASLWRKAGINPIAAASWHRNGYTPNEALPRIAAGLTPRQAAAQDAALIAELGPIGYVAAMLQIQEPGATLIVDPDAEAAIEKVERS